MTFQWLCREAQWPTSSVLYLKLLWLTPLWSWCCEVPEKMRSVLQAALDLSTSTKPFDSVSAAHLLHLLLPQPHLTEALLHCAQEQGLPFHPPSPLPNAPEAVILELNTLAGRIKMHCPNTYLCVFTEYKKRIICLCSSVLSGAAVAVLSAVGGSQGGGFSLAGSCFLSSLRQSPLHHCCPAASQLRVSTRITYTTLFRSLVEYSILIGCSAIQFDLGIAGLCWGRSELSSIRKHCGILLEYSFYIRLRDSESWTIDQQKTYRK